MKLLHEITPLSEKDCFYIVERHKTVFSYPIHQHRECELNFIEGGEGIRRVVGDSVEEIGPYELTLIGGHELEHTWEQGRCAEADIREITIQFSQELFPPELLAKNQFAAIRRMLERASNGLTFPLKAIMQVYPLLDRLASETDRFEQYLHFLKILNTLAESDGGRVLASSAFVPTSKSAESRRILQVKQFILQHYAEPVRLEDIASVAGMTPSAFSRYFRQQTGRTVKDHLIDVRLGHAARMLVDTQADISEICYGCGFNNLSNFNRLFKARRGYAPREFRSIFKKNRVLV